VIGIDVRVGQKTESAGRHGIRRRAAAINDKSLDGCEQQR